MQDFRTIRKTARALTLNDAPRLVKGTIAPQEKFDLFQIDFFRRSRFDLRLKGIKANLILDILNGRGQRVERSNRPGQQPETVTTNLDPGTYYVKVLRTERQKVRYRLNLFAERASPILTNQGTTLLPGATVTISRDLLQASDPDRTPEQITYTLTKAPTSGRFELNGRPLNVYRDAADQFTQADIDSRRLKYTSLPKITQLTDTPAAERAVAVSGSNVVWNGDRKQQGDDDIDIFFYDSSTNRTIQLTTDKNFSNDFAAGISGSNVLWSGFDGDSEVFWYNGQIGQTKQLTNNSLTDIAQAISGSNIIWNSYVNNLPVDAFFYNGATNQTIKLVNPNGEPTGTRINAAIAISGSDVVWDSFDGNDSEVFLYSGITNQSIQLTNNNTTDFGWLISEQAIVWRGFDGNDFELFFYDRSTGKTTQLTNNTVEDIPAGISGANLVWNSGQENTSEVFFYNGTTKQTIQLTQNQTRDTAAGVFGSSVIWTAASPNSNRATIFLYNGTTGITTQLTGSSSPQEAVGISDSTIVWNAIDDPFSSNDFNIYLADLNQFATTEQFSFTVSDGLGGVTSEQTFIFSVGADKANQLQKGLI